ncbi:cuticle protein 18.6-like [Penaeus vannamei]|uniref:cuticle protein 18.6-like n=1 Tax=Penaeus vannamei TaxID=6689 RepID=UPI00387FA599
MSKVALVILSLVATAWADDDYSYRPPTPIARQPQYLSAPARYNYQWGVSDQFSGNFYGQREQRNGDNTRGSYYVRLPDSRLMKVEYYADATGYHPTITFEGEAQYPNARAQTYTQPARAQTYTQPARVQKYTQPAHVQTYTQPARAQTYTQPARAQTYTQPARAQTYTQPARVQTYTQPAHVLSQAYARGK